ncbi:stage II sporulation protein M [Gracilibacillus alcaliphilus]|uniref:stage II sporulation protein M n=1 Tax=Gracilibacillus alcaliphilus TaxID=1401441 RepID=UPI00195B4341|nr:stage II sporulation protein M [Gracilibacillus alcaliphilus]MBM7677781.1 putative membrane protein SpoIIM required for sporulation [Gracilibacillus alcaliphilus]
MRLNQFIKQNRGDWQYLEQLILQLPKKKKADTIDEFQQAYQKVARQLSYSQTYFPNEDITRYLNELVGKAHNTLYQSQHSSWKQAYHFFSSKFIGLLLEQWKAVLIAMLLFLFGGLASFFAVIENPSYIYGILPEEMAQSIDPVSLGQEPAEVNAPLMSVEILTNNIQVAILAFAGGITLGILTVYVLIYNGVIVGAIAGLFWNYSNSYVFWAYIVPHGVIELLAIFIAGGAGLLMGYKIFVPGIYSRGYQLKKQTIRSVKLLIGTIPLFIIAGIIEGYITPSNLSLEMKYAVAAITAIALAAYMIIGHSLMRHRELKQASV